jgi:hypothetical protein
MILGLSSSPYFQPHSQHTNVKLILLTREAVLKDFCIDLSHLKALGRPEGALPIDVGFTTSWPFCISNFSIDCDRDLDSHGTWDTWGISKRTPAEGDNLG